MCEQFKKRIEQALIVCLLGEALFINATNQQYALLQTMATVEQEEEPEVNMALAYEYHMAGVTAELYKDLLLIELPTMEEYQMIKEMDERHTLADEYAGFVSDFSTWWKSAQQLDIKCSNNVIIDGEELCVQERIYNIRLDDGNAHVKINRGDFHVEEYFNTKDMACYMDFDGYKWGHLTPATTTDALWVFCTNNADASTTMQRLQEILDFTVSNSLYNLSRIDEGYELLFIDDSKSFAQLADLFATRSNVKQCVAFVSVTDNKLRIEMRYDIYDDTIDSDSYVYEITKDELSDVTAPESCYWSMCDLPTLERKFATQYNN